jgi:hypothetical protein
VIGRRVGKGEAHKSATVDDKMKISQGQTSLKSTSIARVFAWAKTGCSIQ